jgi:hypothetical protein
VQKRHVAKAVRRRIVPALLATVLAATVTPTAAAAERVVLGESFTNIA